MTPPPAASDELLYRVQGLETRVKKLEDLEPAVLANEMKHLREDLNTMSDRLKSNQIALWSLTGSFLAIAGSIIVRGLVG